MGSNHARLNSHGRHQVIDIKGTVYLRRWIRERRPFWRLFHPKRVTGNKMENVNTTQLQNLPEHTEQTEATASAARLPCRPRPAQVVRASDRYCCGPQGKTRHAGTLSKDAILESDPDHEAKFSPMFLLCLF